MRMEIIDLNYDVLKYIVSLVSKSSDGADDFVRLMTVCKALNQFSEDKDVLKSVNIAHVGLYPSKQVDIYFGNRLVLYSFHCVRSILIKCACAGNENAQNLLARVIISTASQILNEAEDNSSAICVLTAQVVCLFKEELNNNPEFGHLTDWPVLEIAHHKLRAMSYSFLEMFMERQDSNSGESYGVIYHYRLVRMFLSRCSPLEYIKMSRCLVHYFRYFSEAGDYLVLQEIVKSLDKVLYDYDAFVDMLKRAKNRCYTSGILSNSRTRQFRKRKEMNLRMKPVIYRNLVLNYGLDVDVVYHEGVKRKILEKFEETRANLISFLDCAFL